MYCRNCGEQFVTDQAAVCLKCGTQNGYGVNYCPVCGAAVNGAGEICMQCGASLKINPNVIPDAKSKMVAGLLGIFLGCFGVHNFYLGFTQKAVIQLICTLAGFVLCCIGIGAFIVLGIEIWGIVEGIMILTGNINQDARGIPLKD